MANRYDNRRLIKNDMEQYDNLFEDRGVNYITQYTTGQLKYPTVNQIRTLKRVQHIWTTGDRYFKIASQFYGDPRYWWVIAHYNKKPTESSLTPGEIIYIPMPLERILNFILE